MNIYTTYDLDQTVWVLHQQVVWIGKIAQILIRPGNTPIYTIYGHHEDMHVRIQTEQKNDSMQLIFTSFAQCAISSTRRSIADLQRRLQIQQDRLARYLKELKEQG